MRTGRSGFEIVLGSVDAIEIFGAMAVTAMMLCYAAEDRDPRFTLAFGFACLASSAYAAMIGSWPFMVIEFVWAGVAFFNFARLDFEKHPLEQRQSGTHATLVRRAWMRRPR